MSPKHFSLAQLWLVLLVFALGCSGSGNNPVIPATNISSPEATEASGDTGGGHAAQTASRILWNWYEIEIDPETLETLIIPERNLEATFNVTKFLQLPAGNPLNLWLTVVDATQFATNGLIELDINITHPFPGSNNLRGFDVMGVFMSSGSMQGLQDMSLLYPDGLSEAWLRNADGYTRWMNSTEFTQPGLLGFTPGSKGIPGFYPSSIINGYKYFAENLGATDDLPTFFQTAINVTARGSFKAGSTLTRRYDLKFPMSGGKPFIRFQYAVLASWAAPDPASLPNPAVGDFPLAANLQEPLHLEVTDNGSTLYFTNATDFGGNLQILVEVFDWQGASNPGGVPAELSHLWIEDPGGGIFSGGYIDVLTSAAVSAGAGNSSVFTVDIVGCTPLASGPQEFLIIAESASPTSYNQGFGQPYPASAPLAAYTRYLTTVATTNPCPTPTLTGPMGVIYGINDVVPQLPITGTGFQTGTQLAAEMRRTSGDIAGTNVSVLTSTTAEADLDFTSAAAGMYDFYFMSGCGAAAPLLTGAVEINTPPTSTGITGPATGDGNLGIVSYNANASDSDTDPVDVLAYTWNVIDAISMVIVIGPVSGDPLSFNFQVLPVSQYNVQCDISDGYSPADLSVVFNITRTNTQPTIGTPSGQYSGWYNTSTITYNVVAADIDPGQTLTYLWSIVPQGNPPVFTIPGDPTPGDLTIIYNSLPGPGLYDLTCRVDDGSGAANGTAISPIYTFYAAGDPYADPVPVGFFSQVITPAFPSSQGVLACGSWRDSFYSTIGPVPFTHPDIAILSGPSIGLPGVMMIADEFGAITGFLTPPMGWAHFTCPYATGAIPSWMWWNTGLFPLGPDMFPSVVHYDGNSAGEIFVTNSMLTNKLIGLPVPDPSVFQHYVVGGVFMNDLYTSLFGTLQYDIAADTTAGFDMGSVATPMNSPLYGLYTQDASGILFSCGGPVAGAPAAFPVNFMRFPGGGIQPPATAVDAAGSLAIVAQLPLIGVGTGPSLFNILPGGPCPAGVMAWPDPYYALAIDDDPTDNFFPSGLPQPIGQWVIAAAIDGDRDVEIYEIDYGVPAPGPSPLVYFATIPMGSYLGGSPTAYALDVEFISNFSGFGGTTKPVWPEDLLAVLITDTIASASFVEIYSLASGIPTLISRSMFIVSPPTIYGVPGVAYRLDVDEVTGDIYMLHEDSAGSSAMAVTIIPY